MKAKLKGAKIIHVDPRFTRTSALANIYAPVRAGSDIAFLGGLIRHIVNDERWRKDPFFQTYLKTYTNAATTITKDFKDTEEMEGVFSGLMEYTGDPMNGFKNQYENKSWQYEGTQAQDQGRTANTAQSGEQGVESGQEGQPQIPANAPLGDIPKYLKKPPPRRDETLRDPRCVFQIVKRHFERYTPEMVERVTGCPQATFLQVARTILENSGADRTTNFAYAVGWTQHTYGPQMISASAMIQLLLGNIGRPGGGVMALRGHATIQGSTDIPTLYHSIHGYMPAPSALKAKKHDTLRDYLASETLANGYWANMPKFLVSYMKSMYGKNATPENGWGWDWHPKVAGDHSHMPMFINMADGKVRGMFSLGQNPAVGGQNARMQRRALAKLEWLVVKDNFVTETAAFWGPNSPEVKNGELKPEEIKTEVFFFPSNQVAEMDGSFTNTQRLVQWHNKAADAPGDCRSDMWFTYQLGKRLQALYARSTLPRDEGIKNLVWNFDIDEETRRLREAELAKLGPDDAAKHEEEPEGEPDIRKIMREINGYQTADPSKHLSSFTELKDDGSTTCASWIYSGVYPEPGRLLCNSRDAKSEDIEAGNPTLGWGFAWPANRRILYNRASADPSGKPWSERKKYIYWDAESTADPKTGKPWTNPATGAQLTGAWLGPDSPDFTRNKDPNYKPPKDAVGMDAHSGADPFILKVDGVGWLFTPTGLVDGPLPTHYEPVESPVVNPLYPKHSTSPVLKYWEREDNKLAPAGDPAFPYVLTTYRLTEHHLSGVMSRWLPWLSELQPELFTEIGPELAREKGIANLDTVRVSTPRGVIEAKALVTGRMRPLNVAGKVIHHVGLPWHWGFEGVVKGGVVNDLTSLVGDPNVSIHEGKACVCNVEKA